MWHFTVMWDMGHAYNAVPLQETSQLSCCDNWKWKFLTRPHETLSEINCTNVFFGQSPKAIEIKTKINKWDLTKLISFDTAKGTINKTKTTYRMGGNIASDAANKRLISKIYQELIQLNNKEPNQKMDRRLKQTFLQRHPDGQSVQFSCSVVSDSLQPHEPQHVKPPCPSPAPGVYPNSCPLSQWCHPTISSSLVPFSSCPQSFLASGSFPMSQLFTSGGQSIGVLASASVLPMNTQDWSPLGWTGWISLQSKGFSRVFSNITVQKHQFFGAQLSL